MSFANIDILVVGGGGAGGARHGGGGGGGGVIYNTNRLAYEYAYPITVGSGGIPDPAGAYVGGNGQNSRFDDLIALGGGGGSCYAASPPTGGGSGGGGGGGSVSPGIANQTDSGGGGAYYGSDGGSGGSNTGGGGGGGATSVGANATTTSGGYGGYGFESNIEGTTVSGVIIAYGGGGGGGGDTGVGLGRGGGGNGAISGGATNGATNRGGGGGGTRSLVSGTKGGYGGSGVVVVSYPTGSLTATGGLISRGDGRTVHKFNSSGTFTITSIAPEFMYKAVGIVTENSYAVSRVLRLYRESTGELMHETTSSGNGIYELKTPYNDSHYVVCLAYGGNDYNHLIAKNVNIEAL